jgi:hypothetical protein
LTDGIHFTPSSTALLSLMLVDAGTVPVANSLFTLGSGSVANVHVRGESIGLPAASLADTLAVYVDSGASAADGVNVTVLVVSL